MLCLYQQEGVRLIGKCLRNSHRVFCFQSDTDPIITLLQYFLKLQCLTIMPAYSFDSVIHLDNTICMCRKDIYELIQSTSQSNWWSPQLKRIFFYVNQGSFFPGVLVGFHLCDNKLQKLIKVIWHKIFGVDRNTHVSADNIRIASKD